MQDKLFIDHKVWTKCPGNIYCLFQFSSYTRMQFSHRQHKPHSTKLSCVTYFYFTPITIQLYLHRILFLLDTFLKAVLDLTQPTVKSSLVSILQDNIVALVYRNMSDACTHQTSPYHCNSSEQNNLYQSLKFIFCKTNCW